MDKRIIIAGVAFAVVLIGTIVAVQKQEEQFAGDSPEGGDASEISLPEIDKDAVTELEITRPGEEGAEAVTVRLVKVDDVWRVAAPVEAEADQNAVTTALDKIAELEVSGVAATKAANHDRLEVSEAKGIHVVVKAGSETLANLWIGAYRGRSTMVRPDGSDEVAAVTGSIKYAFNKELKDWRNRRVLDEEPTRVVAVRFESENGTYAFHRDAEDNWAPDEGQEEIERFTSSKVQSLVSSIARMRATNFADAVVDEAGAGLAEPSGTVTLTMNRSAEEEDTAEDEGEEAEAEAEAGETEAEAAPMQTETIVLRVGGQVGSTSEYYAQRQGVSTIYVVSQYLADRMRPDTEKFQESEANAEAGGMEAPMMPMMPGGHGGPGGPGGGQIPPELMQQIQQQLNMQAG